MNALQLLSGGELDKYPAFKRELAELLESGREMAKSDRTTSIDKKQLGHTVVRLGAQIELRDAMEKTA